MALSPGHVAGDVVTPPKVPIGDNYAEAVKTSPSCSKCRARKIKCDRAQPVCGPCMRFQSRCHFDGSSVSPSPERGGPSTSTTQAGTKRKRARQACEICRAVKAKCSGTGPCERCVSRGLACNLATSAAYQGGDGEITNIPTPRTVASTATTISNWPFDKATTRGYLDAYFNTANRTAPALLHKPTVLAGWSNGALDQNLLEGIVAVGLFVSDSRPERRAMARVWIQKVQDDILKQVGRQTVAHLRVLVILLRFQLQFGESADAWSLLALAARSAFTLRLNYERDGLDPLIQESNRRLMWTVYQLDRMFSGGIEDLTVCCVERMHIRLPCDERSFEMGIPSKAGFLDDNVLDIGSNVDVHAFKLILLATRDKILRYTKSVRRKGKILVESRPQMESLQAELDSFERSLPSELKLTSQRLAIMGHSREAGTYSGLHSLWKMCHCDLYRFCVPGIREALSKDALASTPPEFIQYCQRRCLSNAVQLCELWSNLYHLESSELLGDEFLAVSIYQVTQILHHLPHLILDEGDDGIASLKKKLTEALQLASPLKEIYTYTIKCLKDSENLIDALGRSSIAQSSPTPSMVEGMEVADQHLASRHSVLPRLYGNQEAGNRDGNRTRNERQGAIFQGMEAMMSSHPSTEDNLLDQERRVEQEVELSDTFLWDPFNMQLNGYYDPGLDFSFM